MLNLGASAPAFSSQGAAAPGRGSSREIPRARLPGAKTIGRGESPARWAGIADRVPTARSLRPAAVGLALRTPSAAPPAQLSGLRPSVRFLAGHARDTGHRKVGAWRTFPAGRVQSPRLHGNLRHLCTTGPRLCFSLGTPGRQVHEGGHRGSRPPRAPSKSTRLRFSCTTRLWIAAGRLSWSFCPRLRCRWFIFFRHSGGSW